MPLALLLLLACGGPTPAKGGKDPGDSGPAVGSPTTGMATSLPQGRVETSGPVTCASPSVGAPGPYEPVVVGETWAKHPDYRTVDWDLAAGGRGMAVADFDGDGHLDLLVPREEFGARFLLGLGEGQFVDASHWFGADTVTGHQGVSAGDLDGDGDPDAWLYGLLGDATLLVNEGDHFRVVDQSAFDTGTAPWGCGGAAAWADLDRDGDLDLFYGRLGGTDPFTQQTHQCDSRMLLNDGSGGLTPSDAMLDGVLQDIRVMVAGFYDFDDDGWLDLYAVSDAPPMRNVLLLNDGNGQLVHTGGTGLEVVTAGMGLAVGDLNRDGIPDTAVSGIRELPTMISQEGLGIWAESANGMGLVPDEAGGRTIAWGGDLADLDNDGHLDAVFTYGGVFGNALPKAQPDDLYRNRGDGTFEHVGDAWGWAEQDVGRGAIAVDVNRDGWLDLVKRELGGVVTVSLAQCGQASWMVVRLHAEGMPNEAAVGARVRFVAGDRTWDRWVTAGSRSYCSSGPPEVHVGLGEVETVERIEVRWPTGETSVVHDIAARQFVELWPPGAAGR